MDPGYKDGVQHHTVKLMQSSQGCRCALRATKKAKTRAGESEDWLRDAS